MGTVSICSASALTFWRARLRALFSAVWTRVVADSTIKTSVAIQVEASEDNPQEYLEKYMRQARFEVEWCEPGEFIRDLYRGWEAR